MRSNHHPLCIGATALLAGLLLVQPASAAGDEAPATGNKETGWALGFSFLSDHLASRDGDAVNETGGGAGVHVSYGFTPSFSLRLFLAGARHTAARGATDLDHGSLTLEALFRFRSGHRTRPYVFGGVGGANLAEDPDTTPDVSGGLAVLGGGIAYGLSRHLHLDVAARWDLINWDHVDASGNRVTVDSSGSAGKILMGLFWNF